MYVLSSSDPFLSFVRSFFRFILLSRFVSCFINPSCLSLNLAFVHLCTEITGCSLFLYPTFCYSDWIAYVLLDRLRPMSNVCVCVPFLALAHLLNVV